MIFSLKKTAGTLANIFSVFDIHRSAQSFEKDIECTIEVNDSVDDIVVRIANYKVGFLSERDAEYFKNNFQGNLFTAIANVKIHYNEHLKVMMAGVFIDTDTIQEKQLDFLGAFLHWFLIQILAGSFLYIVYYLLNLFVR